MKIKITVGEQIAECDTETSSITEMEDVYLLCKDAVREILDKTLG